MKKSLPAGATPAYPSQVRFAELLTLRTLAASTRAEYQRYVRKLAGRAGRDPAELDEAAVRAHLLHLKTAQQYSPSSMRTAVAALQLFYGGLLGREWRLFDLVRAPSAKTLPAVLTRAEVARLFTVVRELRFRTLFRLIYACGLRVGEAVKLEVGDIREGPRLHLRQAKGGKDRWVPLPAWALPELRAWWKTHRHPRLLFAPSQPARRAPAQSPLRYAPGPRLNANRGVTISALRALSRARLRLAPAPCGPRGARHGGGRADKRERGAALHAPRGRGRGAAGGHVRAHAAPLVCDASARSGRLHPAHLGVSGSQLSGANRRGRTEGVMCELWTKPP